MGNLKNYIVQIEENLPKEILKKYNFMSRKEAFQHIHFPKNIHILEEAKRRLAYEELYEIHHQSLSEKYKRFDASIGKSLSLKLDSEYIKDILSKISFELTNAQKIALFQILKDMEKNHAMQRLLEGDVGTGKTIVALIATIHAIKQSKKRESLHLNSISQEPLIQDISPQEPPIQDISPQEPPIPNPFPQGEKGEETSF